MIKITMFQIFKPINSSFLKIIFKLYVSIATFSCAAPCNEFPPFLDVCAHLVTNELNKMTVKRRSVKLRY